MTRPHLLLSVALAGLCTLAACERNGTGTAQSPSNTAVMGGYGPAPSASAADLPPPPAPRGARAELAPADGETTLAIWEDKGTIHASRHTRAAGWETPRPLEDIGGEASNLRLAGNGNGVAMAVWQHTVGRIESLRYSRWEAGRGWSAPDVMPGALPRPRQPGKTAGGLVDDAAARLEVDAQGNARAQWLSGFAEDQVQASTYVPGEGWARPVDLPHQGTASASPPLHR
jgi:hypothetical protein